MSRARTEPNCTAHVATAAFPEPRDRHRGRGRDITRWLLTTAILTVVPLAAMAQLGVSPSRFELQLSDRPSTESVRVFNFSDKDVELVVEVLNWDLDETNTVRELPPDEQSLDQWIVVNPVHFSVPAKESRTVRFSIRPKVRPEAGEHRALLYFRQLPPPPDEDPSFNVLYRVGLAIYAQVGEMDRRALLHAVDVGDGFVQFDLGCPGNAHVRFDGQYAIWPAAAFPGTAETALIPNLGKPDAEMPETIVEAGELPGTPVLPGTRRTLMLELQQTLPPGEYVLDLNGKLGAEPLARAVPFTVSGDSEAAADSDRPGVRERLDDGTEPVPEGG